MELDIKGSKRIAKKLDGKKKKIEPGGNRRGAGKKPESKASSQSSYTLQEKRGSDQSGKADKKSANKGNRKSAKGIIKDIIKSTIKSSKYYAAGGKIFTGR